MNELNAKVLKAIEVLKTFEPQAEPYYICYSGGKDSDVIRILAELSGVAYELHHNLTTVDAPETIQYIKTIPNVIIERSHYKNDGKLVTKGQHKTMFNLIPEKTLPPTRILRYCCSELKEQGGKGRLKVTGVRKAESVNRAKNGGLVKVLGKEKTVLKLADEIGAEFDTTAKGGLVMNMDNDTNRRLVEQCYRTTSTMINPIIDWTDSDVWEFLHYYKCESNPLYKCDSKRIGCIGCPLGGGKSMKREFIAYPKVRDNYLRALKKMLIVRKELGKLETDRIKWSNAVDVLKWWVEDDMNQLYFETPEYLKDIPDELYETII